MMKNGNDFLVVKNLVVTFSRWGQEVRALDSLDLTIPEGQWVILAGHNGSGKTTLMKAISTRLHPDSGQILLHGKPVESMSPHELAQNVFHIHQDPLLGSAPILTVFENLMVADYEAQLNHHSRRRLVGKYGQMLATVGLEDRMKQPARTLSGGERQLLAILIACLRPSSLILLDEPFAALDPSKTETCIRIIEQLHRTGRTLIQVTHDTQFADLFGERTVVLREGKIVYDQMATAKACNTLLAQGAQPIRGRPADGRGLRC